MKFLAFTVVLLPLVKAFQPTLPQNGLASTLSMYRPDLNWDAGKAAVDEPLSNLVPDCTKQETVSILNRGTYEALNGHWTPEYRMPAQSRLPPRRSAPEQHSLPPPPQRAPIPMGNAYGGYFLPDPANNPTNPLASNQYASMSLIGTDRARDQTPEEWRRL